MDTKTCTKCGITKPLEDFHFRKLKNSYHYLCKECKREYDREYWAKTTHKRTTSKRTNSTIIRNRNRDYIIEYLESHPCVDCGESDIVVLEFDHQRDKLFNVTDTVQKCSSIKNIQIEIDKCEVVCANCHKRRTAKQFMYTRYKRTHPN